eukprot:5714622-Pleurochrysis_carterae.AAC.1
MSLRGREEGAGKAGVSERVGEGDGERGKVKGRGSRGKRNRGREKANDRAHGQVKCTATQRNRKIAKRLGSKAEKQARQVD